MNTLYILIRTSKRPEGFRVLMESIRALSYPNICTIVHTDDPRDTYVEGDIIIRGESFPQGRGTAPYNLYNNRLLEAIPDSGWIHFMDDDDKYIRPDAFDFLENADIKKMQIVKVIRWNGQIFPKRWKKQNTFQTECFIVWSDIARKYKWWSNKGGDHYYTRQITRKTEMKWHDIVIAEAQNGKGHGRRIDVDSEVKNCCPFPEAEKVYIRNQPIRKAQNKLDYVTYAEAKVLEKQGYARITYKGVEVYGRNQQENRVS
jgi:hypothetical protein